MQITVDAYRDKFEILCLINDYLVFKVFLFFYSSCLNGGTCVDGINSYTCSCVAGYTGSNCQHRINPCDSVPCLNGATCSNVDGSYDCHCPFGFTGPRCEVCRCKCVVLVLQHCSEDFVSYM